jgi:hypothetical protein
MKNAPMAQKFCDQGRKTTFATQSGVKRTLQFQRGMSAFDPSRKSSIHFAVTHNAAATLSTDVISCGPWPKGRHMRRRDFITVLGSVAATWPLRAQAQQSDRVRRVGVLMAHAESDPQYQANVALFREGLQKLGWVDGQNIRIEVRWAGFDAEAMRRYAKELIALQPDLILSNDTPTTATLLQQTRTIPIVFATVSDPVGSGFVASFARPGGNATGFSTMEGSLGGKWVELLKETVPRVSRIALLFNPATAALCRVFPQTPQRRRDAPRNGGENCACSRRIRA